MLTSKNISKHRQRIHQLLKEIERLAYQSAYEDKLIKGTPGKVFRRCGSKKCKCAMGSEYRHGPYMVIQIFKNGKQRQIALRKDQKEIWERAKNFQTQMQYLSELKEHTLKLEKLIKSMIEKRLEDWPK